MNNLHKLIIIIFLVTIASMIVLVILYPFLNVDGGYYLSYSRDMFVYNAKYYSSRSIYSPLAMIILGVPFLFNANIYSPLIFLLIVIFFNLLNTYLFYRILNYLKIEQLLKIIYTSFFGIYAFLLDGTLLILEPFVLFFILVGIVFIFNKKFILAGFMVFLSFYSKQYGLFALPAFVIAPFIISKYNKNFNNSIKVILGFMIPFVFLLFYVNSFYNNYIDSLLRILSISQQGTAVTGDGHKITRVLYSSYKLLIGFPFLFYGIYLLTKHFRFGWKNYIKKNQTDFNYIIFFSLLFFGSLFQLFFASYFHYFILIIPWLMIITAILHAEFIQNKIDRNVFIIFIAISFVLISLNIIGLYMGRPKSYVYQQKETKVLNNILPRGSKVQMQRKYIFPYQFFLAGYRSSNFETLGYGWDSHFDPDYTVSHMEEGSFYICKKELDINDSRKILSKNQFITDNKDTLILYKIGPFPAK